MGKRSYFDPAPAIIHRCCRFLPASTSAWLITSKADLTVTSLMNPNYAGSLNYICTIIKNDKMIKERPEVPGERYVGLLAIWSS